MGLAEAVSELGRGDVGVVDDAALVPVVAAADPVVGDLDVVAVTGGGDGQDQVGAAAEEVQLWVGGGVVAVDAAGRVGGGV